MGSARLPRLDGLTARPPPGKEHRAVLSGARSVEGLRQGVIELEKPDKKTSKNQIRYALPNEGAHPYTAVSVAKFLGETKDNGAAQNKINETLAAPG